MMIAGRAEEQLHLAQLLVTPGWQVLLGSPGSGKTTLLKWLTLEAAAVGVATLIVRPVEIEASIAMSALSDMVSQTDPALRGCLSPAHQEALNDLIVGNPFDDPGLIRAASTALLTEMSEQGPMLLVLDDAHWIDQQSAETLTFAFRRSLRAQSLVAAFRTNERSLLLDALVAGQSVPLSLGRLPDAAVASIIGSESSLTPALQIGLAKYADGNALRAREIGRAASRGAEALFMTNNVSVQGNPLLSAAQLLSPEHLEVMYVAAQLRDPSVDVLHQLFTVDQVGSALAGSADAGHSITVDRQVVFEHPLFGEAVASILTNEQRRALHSRAALVVDDLVERGRHLSLSSASLDQATRIEVFVASTHAAASGSITLALQLAFRAVDGLALPDLSLANSDTFMHVSSQRWIANLEFRLDDPAAAQRRLSALALRLPDGEHQVRVALDLAALMSWSQTLSVGIDTYKMVLAQSDVGDAGVAEAGMQLAMLQINAGTVDEAVNAAKIGVEAGYRAGGQIEAESMAIDVMARFLNGTGFDVQTLQSASEREDLQHWLSVQCPPFSLGPFLYAWCEDKRALHQFEVRRRIFRARGSSTALLMGIPFEVNLLCSRGRISEARELVQLGISVAEFDNELSRSLSRLGEARLAAHVGELDLAELAVSEAETSFARLEFRLGAIEAANVRMSILAARQDRVVLLETGLRWMNSFREWGLNEPAVIPGLLDLIEASSVAGAKRRDCGSLVADKISERLRGWGEGIQGIARTDAAVAKRWAAAHFSAARRTDVKQTRSLFTQVIHEFAAEGRVFWVARAELAFGRFERREGARRSASELFQSSFDGFEACEAWRWCETARGEDRGFGRRQSSDLLTTIELEVAQLASLGQSNKEISAVLFISAKTVESHLSSVYRKLGINRRTHLHVALIAQQNSGESQQL